MDMEINGYKKIPVSSIGESKCMTAMSLFKVVELYCGCAMYVLVWTLILPSSWLLTVMPPKNIVNCSALKIHFIFILFELRNLLKNIYSVVQ